MNLRSVFKHTCADITAGNAVIWKGPPGFGKTDAIAKVARWFRDQHAGKRVGYGEFFMATKSEISLTGLPWKGEKDFGDGKMTTITDPAMPEWYLFTDMDTGEQLPASMFDRVFLVIEEWGQGSLETKRVAAELLRTGCVGKWRLPRGSARVALTNMDARDGITKEFDFIIGRRGEYEITGDAPIWVEDFADRPYVWEGRQWEVLPFTKAWALSHQETLFEAKPDKQGPWCNPRTLTMNDRYVQSITEMSRGVIPVNDSDFMQGVAGKIGMGAAMSYVGDLQFVIDLPKYEDIVAKPGETPIPDKADLQLLMAYTLASRTQSSDIAQVIQYMSRKEMPKDMSITFVSSLLRRDYKSMIEEPAMKAWISKNAALISVIQSLAA